MTIALCTDEKYSFPCGVCVTSILENNKEEECNIYIISKELKIKTIEKFKKLQKKYRQKVEIILVSDNAFEGLKISERFPESIYYRFMLPQLLNEDKVIYLDCDIIVTSNLKEFWNTDINERACGVVEDQRGDDITLHNRIDFHDRYFNSGVLLMNLRYWRENMISNKLINFIYNNPSKCIFPDQDALNAIISNQVIFLEYKYNYQEMFLQNRDGLYLHKSKWNNLLPSNVMPAIIHYTGSVKPWYRFCTHPYASIFKDYKAISPWKNTRQVARYKLLEKLKNIIEYSIYTLRS